jgi:hypothetical protein
LRSNTAGHPCAPAANFPGATTSVAFWNTEARCAIVPAGPGGIFGSENFGNKFPERPWYMGIVHVAIYAAAVALLRQRRIPLSVAIAVAGASSNGCSTIHGSSVSLGTDRGELG